MIYHIISSALLLILIAMTQANASIIVKRGLWKKDKTIVVRVSEGDPRDISCLEQTVARYSEIIPIQFEFFLREDADAPRRSDVSLRIGRDWAGGWSSLGRSLFMRERMEINIPRPGACGHNTKGLILHEFGHLLGLAHEHQHPATPSRVTQILIQRYGNALHDNIIPFNKIELLRYRYSTYDPESVMHYLRRDSDLSQGDIEMLQKTYGSPP